MHIINIDALSEMFRGNTEKVQLVVNVLIQRIPEWREEARICAETNDHEETRKLCHRIRGAASSVKAEKLTESVTALGDIVKAKQFDKIEAGYTDLDRCLKEVLSFPVDLPE